MEETRSEVSNAQRLAYPWEQVPKGSRVCDIGGNIGHVMLNLLRAQSHLQAVVQDLPSVIVPAKEVMTPLICFA
jgi:hypothetical protein